MTGTDIKITECPRDAMQGLAYFVPTEVKAAYINLLLQVGFDTVDFGSFVSPKAIPQMRDTAEVLKKLDLSTTASKLLAIVANYRGAEDACVFDEVSCLGYPFSISETFQRRNTSSSLAAAFETVKRMRELCASTRKDLLVYLSMGFGNPYGDDWSVDLISEWTGRLVNEGIQTIALSDTIGIATPEQISMVYGQLSKSFPQTAFGVHLHSTPASWYEKVEAAYQSGCIRFDGALKGFGGCPMAKDELTGNIATENLIGYLSQQNALTGLNLDKLQDALNYSVKVFRSE